MKYPDHLILDVKPACKASQTSYWITNYCTIVNTNNMSYENFLNYRHSNLNYNYVLTTLKFKKLKFSASSPKAAVSQSQNLTWSLFNTVFLRKEKLYTKLKYSRCPQYDIVSGGIAGLFAGFLGFLIQEKFGLELLDSGDFYLVLMYSVFITFAFRPLLRSLSKEKPTYSIISLKFLYLFIVNLLNLVVSTLREVLAIQGVFVSNYVSKSKILWKQVEYFSNIKLAVLYIIYWFKNWPKL